MQLVRAFSSPERRTSSSKRCSGPELKIVSQDGTVTRQILRQLGGSAPISDRYQAALRAAVARLDPAALARFEADWTTATARARDEYSLLPARYFVEHWFSWVAVERWPALAARLRACERVVAESPDRAERRAAAAEISQILRQAETATG